MKLKGVIFEDFVNYKLPSMVLEFPKCTFKCDKECGIPICQNSSLVNEPDIEVDTYELVRRYVDNPITHAVIAQGLEPFDSFPDLHWFICVLREVFYCSDPVVIYTGYNKDEIQMQINELIYLENIIIKFGRFIPGYTPHYDSVLGVNLASDNQYAERIS